jgi:MSHA biogenesis protein MshG
MAAFKYQGRNTRGGQVTGIVESANSHTAAAQLATKQIIITKLEETKSSGKGTFDTGNIDLGELLGINAVKLEDLVILCRQMYSLMRAGVPILRAIKGLAESSSGDKIKKALNDVVTQLEGGYALSSALNQHPKVFNSLFVSIIHVGENTGQLDNAFLKLASYFEREQETRKRIKAAIRYPSFVLMAIGVAIVILNIFVIPTFANMFTKLGAELPVTTQLLITSSNFFVHYWPYLIVAGLASVVGLRAYLKTEVGQYAWDKSKLRLPIIGSIIERSILSRFTHSLSTVLRAGVPMTSGLSLVADAVDNTYMRDKILSMRSGVESGESLLRTASNSELFTPLVLQMMAVGEESGRVDELLEEVGDYYEREVDYDLSTLTAKIEPLLLMVVAAMVLVLALGIFTPMWNMASAMQG